MKSETYFADPQRSSPENILTFNQLLNSEKSALEILGATSAITAILDGNRQIVYANETFMNLLGIETLEPILGARPGEAIKCIHASETEAGCGTAEACACCGAVESILECIKTGTKTVRESRITTKKDGQIVNWDLRITTCLIKISEINFYVFSVEDISNEKRRQNLERIFFHDILNSAGNLHGLISLLKENPDPEEEKELLQLSEASSTDLIEEIMNQRQLRAAENGDLIVNPELMIAVEILSTAVERILKNEVSKGKKIQIEDLTGGISLSTDRIILQRILINMLKNAVEATDESGVVKCETELHERKLRFIVNNARVMPENVKLQVFQRSFSTKGTGRGVGTYSIKLLTESYLKGLTGFSSTETEGTTFWIELPLKVNI